MTSSKYTLIPDGYKQCTRGDKCVHPDGCIQPATSEYFAHQHGRKDGFQSQCKLCKRKSDNEYRAANHERLKEKQREDYARDPQKFRDMQKRRRKADPEKVRREDRERYARNPKLKNANAKRYRETHRDTWLEGKRTYANSEQGRQKKREWVEGNREKLRISKREDYRRHPDAYKVRSQQRKLRIRNAIGRYTKADIELQFKSQKGRCWHCGKKFVKGEYGAARGFHIDHLFPLSRTNSNDPRNLVLACPMCNMKKRGKFPHEWNGKLF